MTRGKAPLLIALALGLLAGTIAWSAVKRKELEVRAGWTPTPVLVATVDISEGTVVTQEMIAVRMVPEQFVTASVIKPDSSSYIANQRVLVPVQAGDPLLWSQFETTRAAERLSTKVLKKARAISIAARGVQSVSGWVRPNDHVDVIGTFKNDDGHQVAVTLMQNVIVLATGKLTGTTNVNLVPEAQREYSSVSLLVIPEEAEILTLAQEVGALTLSLRNEEDMDYTDRNRHTTMRTLFDGERMALVQKERLNTIVIIRNSSVQHEQTR